MSLRRTHHCSRVSRYGLGYENRFFFSGNGTRIYGVVTFPKYDNLINTKS